IYTRLQSHDGRGWTLIAPVSARLAGAPVIAFQLEHREIAYEDKGIVEEADRPGARELARPLSRTSVDQSQTTVCAKAKYTVCDVVGNVVVTLRPDRECNRPTQVCRI